MIGTVTGLSTGGESKVENKNDFLSYATRVDKIYAHDDQVGPFARMTINDFPIEYKQEDNHEKAQMTLATSWKNDNNEVGTIRFKPEVILLPLYHKIRIPLECIEEKLLKINWLINSFIIDSHQGNT